MREIKFRAWVNHKMHYNPIIVNGVPSCWNHEETEFVTIEPILDFDVLEFTRLLVFARPTFVNIGADSKNHHLPEPTRERVMQLVEALTSAGIVIRKKINLERLIQYNTERED
jgi:hypothetical protein